MLPMYTSCVDCGCKIYHGFGVSQCSTCREIAEIKAAVERERTKRVEAMAARMMELPFVKVAPPHQRDSLAMNWAKLLVD